MKDSTNAEYKITGRESLDILLTKRRKRYSKFIMDVEGIDEAKAKNFENDLNKFHASCGCTTGNYFLSTTLVLCVVYIYVAEQTITSWKIIILGVAIFLIAAFIGKMIGKLMDNHKFKRTIKSIYQELV